LCEEIDFDSLPKAGMTMLVAPTYVFVASIDSPHDFISAVDENGVQLPENLPVYLDGMAFAGVVNEDDLGVI